MAHCIILSRSKNSLLEVPNKCSDGWRPEPPLFGDPAIYKEAFRFISSFFHATIRPKRERGVFMPDSRGGRIVYSSFFHASILPKRERGAFMPDSTGRWIVSHTNLNVLSLKRAAS